MKNVKFFLVSLLFVYICTFFPLQGQAEEIIVQEQNVSEVNEQEEQNIENQEPPVTRCGMKQDRKRNKKKRERRRGERKR